MHSVWAPVFPRPASWIRLFSKVRFEPLMKTSESLVLSLMSEFMTLMLLLSSRWKIWVLSQPPQSTVQPLTVMLLV